MPLGTKDPRAAEPILVIANSEFEKKAAAFHEPLADALASSLTSPEVRQQLPETASAGAVLRQAVSSRT